MKRWVVAAVVLAAAVVTTALIYGAMVAAYTPGRSNLGEWPAFASAQDLRVAVAHTYVLNLPRRQDKKRHMQRMLQGLGLRGQDVTWVPGHDAQWDGVGGACASTKLGPGKLGCSLGHLRAFDAIAKRRRGDDNDDAWYLFFQDDAEPALPPATVRARMVEALRRSKKEGRHAVYFSCCDFWPSTLRGKPVDAHRWELGVACPHAIALTRSAAVHFADHIRRNMCHVPCDFAMRDVAKRLGATVVLGRRFNPALPFAQFWRRGRPDLIHDKGLFGQRRGDLSSDISRIK